MSNEGNQDIEALLEDYDRVVIDLNGAPPGTNPDGSFNQVNISRAQSLRAAADIVMAKVIEARQYKINFATVERKSGTAIICYNPFGDYLKDFELAEFTTIPIPDSRTKPYTRASNGAICWTMKVLTCDPTDFFVWKFGPWLSGSGEKSLSTHTSDFCKLASVTIRKNPHILFGTIAEYINAFIMWLSDFETDSTKLVEIYSAVVKGLKHCVFKKDRKAIKLEGGYEKLEAAIKAKPTMITIKDASMACHKGIKDLHLKAEKGEDFIAKLKQDSAMKKKATDERLKQKSKGSVVAVKKRKLDEVEGKAEEPPAKKTKIEVPNLDDHQEEDDGGKLNDK